MDISIEEIKQELKSYIHDKTLLTEIDKEIEEYRTKATSCTAELSDMPKGSRKIKDKLAEYASIIADLQMEKLEEQINMEKQKKQLEDTIKKIEQPYKNILYFRYILDNKLEDVADMIKYDYKYVCKLHSKALFLYRKQKYGY